MIIINLRKPFLLIFFCGTLLNLSCSSGQQENYEQQSHVAPSQLDTPAQQISLTTEDSLTLKMLLQKASEEQWDTLPREELISKVAKHFLQTRYIAGTLEQPGDEQLVINLQGLDCTTYLENVLAISKIIKSKAFSFPEFSRELTNIRYREGKIEDYPSRLHYFTDWLHDNQKKGNIDMVKLAELAQPLEKQINFMTEHTGSYEKLSDSAFLKAIRTQEAELNSREVFYLPQEKIHLAENLIHNGDIIAITTSIPGLDVMHVGLALKENKKLHLIHASLSLKEVVISDKTLADFVKSNKNMNGIIVARARI